MKLEAVYKAQSIDDVLNKLYVFKDQCSIIAGGTDLILHLRHKRIAPKVLIDISDLREVKEIEIDGPMIKIGAAVTFTDFIEKGYFDVGLKGLKEAAETIGSPQIRNRGTLGGNICNGSPAADMVPPLLALDAQLEIKGKNNQREIALHRFYKGKGQVQLEPGEMVYKIKFKNPPHSGLGFSKLGLRKALAISRICTSVFLQKNTEGLCEQVRVANGALGKYPIREKEVEQFLQGRLLDKYSVEESVHLLQRVIEKRLAGRPSLDYKSEAIKGVFREAMGKAIDAMDNKG